MDDDLGLPDYCKRCAVECGCNRFDVIYAPHTIIWAGPGRSIVAYYECEDGHQWKCWWSDLWLDAEIA
jgi:hypothetical protein